MVTMYKEKNGMELKERSLRDFLHGCIGRGIIPA